MSFSRENHAFGMTEIDTGLNETKFLVKDLQPFTTYSFKVSGENKIGFSIPSTESFPTMTHRESKKFPN